MPPVFTELCTVLVGEVFGSLPSSIFALLVARGRMSRPQLLYLSKLLPRYLDHGLAILVQRQLVLYHQSPYDGVTYYEANTRNAYDLIRFGKHAQFAESQFGEGGATMVSEFQARGLFSANDLNHRLLIKGFHTANPSTAESDRVNGVEHEESRNSADRTASDVKKDTEVLKRLFASRHVVRARDIDFIPPHDFHDMVESMVTQEKFPAGPKGKEKAELTQSVLSRKRRWRDDNEISLSHVEGYVLKQSEERRRVHSVENETDAKGLAQPRKQRKLNSGRGYQMSNGVKDGEEDRVDPESDEAYSKRTSFRKKTVQEVAELHGASESPSRRRKLDEGRASNGTSYARSEESRNLRIRSRGQATEQVKQLKRSKRNVVAHGEENGPEKTWGDWQINDATDAFGEIERPASENNANNKSSKASKRRKLDDAKKPTYANIEEVMETSHDNQRTETEKEGGEGEDHDAAIDPDVSILKKIEPNDGFSEESTEPFFRLNLEKFNVSMRSQRLVELATQHLGEPTSKVYAALLSRLERKIPRCQDPHGEGDTRLDEEDLDSDDGLDADDAYTVSSREIDAELDPNLDLGRPTGHGKSSKDKVNGVSITQQELNRYPSTDKSNRISEIEQHLLLLADHAHQFVHPVTVGGEQHWHVDFSDLTSLLIQQVLEDVVSTRYDFPSARIVRLLNTNGKLEEKQLSDLTLLPQKELRAKLTMLQEAGYVDLQEVPRDVGRQANRSMFLWFFDQERIRMLMLNNIYKAMTRLLQRSKVEQEKVMSVIEKSQRTDVVGREDKYLTTLEKDALKEWQRKEEMIWTQVARLDEQVAVLRDFKPL